MSTITIIQGNNNDKDNIRAYMVKGESGVSPTVSVERTTGGAILTTTDYTGTHSAQLNDGVSPTVETSKTAGVTTVTITDYEGEHTATINDGETYEVPTGSVIGFDGSTIPEGYEEVPNTFGSGIPTGSIIQFAGQTAPAGFLICDGSAISRNNYSDLFNTIGTAYGAGDESTTFNIPNLKGRVPVGLNSNDTDFDTLGETGGEKAHTLTVQEMPTHNHAVSTNINCSSFGTNNALVRGAGGEIEVKDSSQYINNSGDGQAHNNLQPYIVLNYIIKY